jgi:hypothetical protein
LALPRAPISFRRRFQPTRSNAASDFLTVSDGAIPFLGYVEGVSFSGYRQSRQLLLDQSREETCSKRQCSVVEIVVRVVHGAAADGASIANRSKILPRRSSLLTLRRTL